MPIDPSIPLQGKTPQLPSFADNIAKIQNIKNMQAAEAGIRAESDEKKRNFEARMKAAEVYSSLIPVDQKTGKPSYNKEGKLQNPETGEVIDMGNVYRQAGVELTRAGFNREGYNQVELSMKHDMDQAKTLDDVNTSFKKQTDTMHAYLSALPQDQQEAAANKAIDDLQRRQPWLNVKERIGPYQKVPPGEVSPTITQLKNIGLGAAESDATRIALHNAGINPEEGHTSPESSVSKQAREILKSQGMEVPENATLAEMLSNPATKGLLEGMPATKQIAAATQFSAKIAANHDIADLGTRVDELAKFNELTLELMGDPTFTFGADGNIIITGIKGQYQIQRALAWNAERNRIMPEGALAAGFEGNIKMAKDQQAVLRNKIEKIKQGPDNLTYNEQISAKESGGSYDAQNPLSSAHGRYGLLDGTTSGLLKKGVPGVPAGTTLEQVKSTPKLQDAVMAEFTKQNKTHLTNSLGREPIDSELSLAHMYGAAGASSIIKAPPGTKLKDVLSNWSQIKAQNPQLNDNTSVEDVIKDRTVKPAKQETETEYNTEQTKLRKDYFRNPSDKKLQNEVRKAYSARYDLPDDMKAGANDKLGSSRDNPVIVEGPNDMKGLPKGTWVKTPTGIGRVL